MDFGILGPLKVRGDDREIVIGSKKQRQLLTVLLVNAGTVLSSDRLTAVLWGEKPPARPLQALYTYISRLRDLLPANGGEVLVSRPPGYVLQLGPEGIDAARFELLLSDARTVAATEPGVALARLDEALALWRGPAYAEFADLEFARAEAMRLEELRLTAVEERFDAGLAMGRHSDLVGAIEAYAGEHPLRERPRAQWMLSLYRCGRHAEALAVYRAFRQRLDEELGVEPSVALRSLETAMLRQGSDLDWLPPSRTPPVLPQTPRALPGAASSLVGRDSDVAAVAAALADRRLVTLTGVGGVGKTRLAIQAATRATENFPDGVWFCELAPVADGTAVGHALAAAMGVRQQPGWSIEQSIVAFLSTRHALLVVDNCEHVLEDSTRLLEAVVRDCSRVTVLATSRIGLG